MEKAQAGPELFELIMDWGLTPKEAADLAERIEEAYSMRLRTRRRTLQRSIEITEKGKQYLAGLASAGRSA